MSRTSSSINTAIQRLDCQFQCLVAPLHHFVGLLRLANCLSTMAASSKFVTDVIKCCIHVCGDTKGHQIQPRSVKHKLLFEHNFKHNAIVLRVTLKSIRLKFSSIMYLTLPTAGLDVNTNFLCQISLFQAFRQQSAGEKSTKKKKTRGDQRGKGGENVCKHSLTELFPPLIDCRPRNCDMNYKVLTGQMRPGHKLVIV